VTLLTASVLAKSSPTPDEPSNEESADPADTLLTKLTTGDDHDLVAPVKLSGSVEQTPLVAVEAGNPFDEPWRPQYKIRTQRRGRIGSQNSATNT